MQVLEAPQFTLTLPPEWRLNRFDDDDSGFFYFEHQRLDAGLSALAFRIDAGSKDLGELAREATAVSLPGVPIETMNFIETPAGYEIEYSGVDAARGRFMHYGLVRPGLVFSLRIDSETLSAEDLAELFDAAQLGLVLK